MAGTVTYYFPSSSGAYVTAAGNVRLKFWYTDTPDEQESINAICLKIDPINIPLEVDSGNNEFRYASTKIKFKYHANIESMLSNFESESDHNSVFMDIILDGSLYWRGILEWQNIRRSDYYIDDGTLKYKYITFDFSDAMAYLWKKNKTLSDASYSDGIVIGTLLDNIFALLGFSSSDIIIDTNIKIDEDCGSSYNLDSLKIREISSNTTCTAFLKEFMLDFACFIYILKGKVYVVARNGGSTLSITNSHIRKLDKCANLNSITYVRVFTNTEVGNIYPFVINFEKTQGTKNDQKTNFNYDREHVYLKSVYITGSGTVYQPGDKKPSGGDTDNLIDSEAAFLLNAEVQTGDMVFYNDDGIYAPVYGIVLAGITDTNLPFYNPDNVAVDINAEYWVEEGYGASPYFRGKAELLVDLVYGIYDDYFLTSPDIFKIKLDGLSTYDDLSKRFILDGNNHRARNARVDIENDKISMELVKVT